MCANKCQIREVSLPKFISLSLLYMLNDMSQNFLQGSLSAVSIRALPSKIPLTS